MRVLVTGATGFLGSAVVRQLLGAGHAVRLLRRATSRLDLLGEAAARAEHAVGDVTDPDALADALAGVSHVVHAAAVVAFGPRDRPRLRAANVRGTAHVVDAALAAGVTRLVHVSSIAALGRAGTPGAVLDETAAWAPGPANTAYAVSKHDAETEVRRGGAEGLEAVILNPALIFGRGRAGEGTQALVDRVAAGRMRLAPTGSTAVVDVRDVAAAAVAALTRGAPGARYVLAAETLAWPAILVALADAHGVPPPRRTVGRRALAAAGALAEAWTRVTGRDAGLSREKARTASGVHRYDGSRAARELGVAYRPFAETAAWIAGA